MSVREKILNEINQFRFAMLNLEKLRVPTVDDMVVIQGNFVDSLLSVLRPEVDKAVSYWREKCFNDTMSAKKSGWDACEKFYKDRIDKAVAEARKEMAGWIETHKAKMIGTLTDFDAATSEPCVIVRDKEWKVFLKEKGIELEASK